MTDELSPEQRNAFASLGREMQPPAELEDRVVDTLRAAGMLRRGGWRHLGAIAASLLAAGVLFASGVATGQGLGAAPAAPGDFILLLRGSPDMNEPTTAPEIRALVAEYAAWARDSGAVAGGEKLASAGSLLGPAATVAAIAAPETEGIQGYFLIQADDAVAARRLAASCPHLKYGGRIEVRRIERF